MKPYIPLVLITASLVGGLAFWGETADRVEASEKGKSMLKAIVHINFSDSERQKAGLKNVTNILKEEKEAEIEVVCHGGGIGLLVKDQSEHDVAIAQLVAEGVRFVACENSLRDKSIPKVKLLPDVTTVPSGAVEVIRKQQDGFGYFRP